MHIRDHALGLDVQLTDPAVWADPYPLYAQLRDAAPLIWCKQPFVGRARLLARYDDVAEVLKDAKRFHSNASSVTGKPGPLEGRFSPKLLRAFSRSMIFADGLDHRRLRGLVTKAFTPARVDQIQRRIEGITNDLLDEVAQNDTFDLMADFALPLPLRIISELLGVHESEQEYFHRSLQKILNVRNLWTLIVGAPSFRGLHRFFTRLFERKRADPADDLTSALIAAEEEGERLTPEELMGMTFLLLFAGHETTVNLLGNGTLALLEHPEQLARVREDPSLVPSAIEEVLRYYSPAHFPGTRYATEACEVGGVALERGDQLVPLVAAANRDGNTFPEPETFDVGREPNRHLAFGAGRHFCIGAHLSRVEGRIAFTSLLERFPNLRLAVDRSSVKWSETTSGLLGLESLPVAVT